MLTHADASAIAAQTPTPRAPGAGGLPVPRTTLEAGFFIALARRDGIFAFWAQSPDTTNGDVTLHWITEGLTPLVYRQGETRCVLVSSVTSTATTKMYSSLESCSAKLADGVLTVAASAAPPPPPGGTDQHLFDPLRAPPPPPVSAINRTSLDPESMFSCVATLDLCLPAHRMIHNEPAVL